MLGYWMWGGFRDSPLTDGEWVGEIMATERDRNCVWGGSETWRKEGFLEQGGARLRGKT